MAKGISTAAMTREEWLKQRKKGIGGSDAGAICGLNPYSSAMSVYLDKTTEEISETDNESMRQGRDLEDYVARRFMEETGWKVRRSHRMYRHEKYPFLFADVDRLIVGMDAGLECKTASAYSADKWKDGEIPAHYMIQCYHYMAVTGRRNWYLAVVILGKEFKYTKITWDDNVIQNLVAIEVNFWEQHVAKRVMPEPDGSKICDEVLEKYFRTSGDDTTVPLIGFDQKLKRRMEIDGLMKQLEREQKQIDQEVKLFMGEHERAASERYQVSWQNVPVFRLDTKKIKEEQPGIYRDYLRESSSRRFTVKIA